MTINQQYISIERAISYLRDNIANNPALGEVADFIGVSEFHLQRTFKKWVGITPKQYVHFLLGKQAVPVLLDSCSVMDASLALGLSSTSRLHDLVVKTTALTPAEIMARGDGVTVNYGFAQSPLGRVLIGWTDKGICHLSFVDGYIDHKIENNINGDNIALSALRNEWFNAHFIEQTIQCEFLADTIFNSATAEVSVLISGTNLQVKVWEALLSTMPDQMITYSDLAAKIGLNKAYRAVARAVGQNKIAYLIPCHRVIRAAGDIGNYRWGRSQKQKLFLWEKIGGKLK